MAGAARRREIQSGDIVRYRRKFIVRGQAHRALFEVMRVSPGEDGERVLLEAAPEGKSRWFSGGHLKPARGKARYVLSSEIAVVETAGERVAKVLMGDE